MQLSILSSNISCEPTHEQHTYCHQVLTRTVCTTEVLLSEVCVLASLMLVKPATNAISERSFSALRRIKSYLRATMSQERLNQSMVLHVHKHLTDPLPPPFWNSYLVLFYAKSVGFWGGAPDPDGGACSTPPYLLAGPSTIRSV